MKALDFVKPGEHIMVIFTNGTLLEFGDDNTGITGNWGIHPHHSIDRVIIYMRDHLDINTLYIANHDGVEFVDKIEGYKIRLRHVQYVGKTNLNWNDFADTGANPVRYLPLP